MVDLDKLFKLSVAGTRADIQSNLQDAEDIPGHFLSIIQDDINALCLLVLQWTESINTMLANCMSRMTHNILKRRITKFVTCRIKSAKEFVDSKLIPLLHNTEPDSKQRISILAVVSLC
jgi:hypothetical protein